MIFGSYMKKKILKKNSVTPKVRIEISGGVFSTISSYKPLFAVIAI